MSRGRLGMGGVVVALLAATIGVLTLAPASAATVSVANDTDFRAALSALSGDNSGPHVIDITADFTVSLPGDPTYTGTQPLTIDGNGHTISGGGPGDPHRILRHSGGQPLTVNDLTLTNGNPSSIPGGAINVDGAVTVTGSTFTNNTASAGDGGAIFSGGSATVTDSTFTGNSARGSGGAINSGGVVTVTGSTFTGNSNGGSGGAINSGSSVTVTGSTFANNTTGGSGGAISSFTAAGTVTATNSTFANNTAAETYGSGGGIFGLGSVRASNSTFTGNTATIRGGAIYATSVALVYATVVSNSAAQIAIVPGTALDSFGSVVALASGSGANCEIDGSTSTYSYDDDGSCEFNGTGDTDDGPDPLLLALGNYGGPTQTRLPQETSPLVDAIPAAACTTVIADQRGQPRPDSPGAGCDIGAVEGHNEPPMAEAGPDQTVDAGATVTLDGTGSSDPDSDPLTYSWVQTAGPAVTLVGANTAQPTFTAPAGPAVMIFEVTVDDGRGSTDTDTVSITLNQAPTADASAHQTVIPTATVTLNGTGSSDPDADPITYSWVQTAGPAVTITGATTSQPTFTAPTGPATLTFELTVCDDGAPQLCDTDTVTVTVATASAGGPYSTQEGSSVSLSGSTSPDVPGAGYEWDVDGDGQFDDATGATPTVSAATLASIGLGDGPDSSALRVRVTSGAAYTPAATTLTITNVAPMATFSNNGPVTIGNSGTVTFSAQGDPSAADTTAGFRYAYDFDNDGTFEVGDGTYAGGTTSASAVVSTSVLNAVGPHTVGGRIIDKDGGYTPYTTTITVDPPPNVAPVADAGPDQTVNSGAPVTLDATGSSDADSDPLTYAWVQTAGPSVPLTGATSAQPTFTAPTGPVTLTFELTVCDDAATPLCDTDTVTITVRPPPIGPPPPPPPPTLVCGGLEVTVNLALGQSPTNGPDVIRGTPGNDIINGLGGNDVICGSGGIDIVSGNQGDDRLFGGGGDDEMRGNAGDDTLRGRAGNDLLYGQALNDLLDGGTETDTCRGGTGLDRATACETTVGVP